MSPMAGSQGIQQGPRVLIIAIALAAAIAAAAQAQTPSLPSPTPPSDFASVVGGPETFVKPTEAVPSYYAGEGYAPTAPIVQMGLFDTITESLCGQPDPNTWRPLPCSTFFSEGWNEAWVPSPAGSGGAPRQGWINAMDGNLYRLWFFTFAQAFNNNPRGNAYLGSYTLLAPFSRRMELIINVPFVVRNNETPHGSPPDYHATRRDACLAWGCALPCLPGFERSAPRDIGGSQSLQTSSSVRTTNRTSVFRRRHLYRTFSKKRNIRLVRST